MHQFGHQFGMLRDRGARRLTILIAGLCGLLAFGGALAVMGESGPKAALIAPPSSIFSAKALPAVASASDKKAAELGVKFVPDVVVWATGIRFYKGPTNTGTHSGTLWTGSGRQLAHVVFKNETASGWQTAALSKPVPLWPGTSYVVSYHAPNGGYAFTYNYFAKTIDAGPVTMPAETKTSGNGVYHYGGIAFPKASSTRATNYWVDVTLSTTPPAVTTTSKSTPPTTKPVTTTTKATTPTTKPTTTTTKAPTTTTAPRTTTTAPPSTGSFPSASTTGVPAGKTLTAYTGPDVIRTCGTVLDSVIITGELDLRVGNGTHSASTPCLTIKNSLIKGPVNLGYQSQGFGPTVITDTEIAVPTPNAGVMALMEANYFAWRLNIHGGQTNVYCDGYCELHDSYVHDNYYVSPAHLNGFHETGTGTGPIVLDHNSFRCDLINAGDGIGGCAGDIVFIPDPGLKIQDTTVTNNLLMATNDAYFCAYTGADGSSAGGLPGDHIVWSGNMWQRGAHSVCGAAGGGPVKDWRAGSTNVWCDNRWDDGSFVSAADETC